MIPVDDAVELARRMAEGDITHDQALAALDLLDDGADPPDTPAKRARRAEGALAFVRDEQAHG
jgi:hypothetical protein